MSRNRIESTEDATIISRNMVCMMSGCYRLALYDVSIRANGASGAFGIGQFGDYYSYCGTCTRAILRTLAKRRGKSVTAP